jgi:GMP synthase-like glutamine amidotransferase
MTETVVDEAQNSDQARQKNALKVIDEALSSGTEDQIASIRRKLGVGGAIQRVRKNKKQTNAQARNLVLSAGSIVHPDLPNGDPWSPGPSEGMVASMEKHIKAVGVKLGKEVTAKQLATAVLRKKHLDSEYGDGATSTMTSREAEEKYGLNSIDPDDLAAIAQEEFPTDAVAGNLSGIGFDEGSVG